MATTLALTDDQKTISQLEDLLTLMTQLLEADSATHKSIDAQLQQQYDADPSETNKMRLALALTAPGHTHAELMKSQQLVEELQSKENGLPRVISIYLKTRIDATKHTSAMEDKVKALSSSNKDLNQELGDVKAQIKALTEIERNLEKANPRTGTR